MFGLDILGIIKGLVGLGDTVKSVSGDIAKVKIAAQEAGTEEKRIKSLEELKMLEVRRDALVEEAKSSPSGAKWNQGFRIFLSIPAALLLWKLIVYDEMFGWGVTKIHSKEIWTYIWMVCGFYLLNRTIEIVKR